MITNKKPVHHLRGAWLALASALLLLNGATLAIASTKADWLNRATALTQKLQNEFAQNGVYAEDVTKVNGQQVKGANAFCWPLNTQMRVLVSSANYDPTKETRLRNFSDNMVTLYLRTANGASGYNASAGGGLDRYYDDNGGMLIALMEAYNLTNDSVYLTRAKQVYTFMLTGEDSVQGGGLYQREKVHEKKVSTATLQAIMGALMIYKKTNQAQYLTDANRLFNWLNATLKDSASGLYNQSIDAQTGAVNTIKLIHNGGYGIIANILFYDVTGNNSYLVAAENLAAECESRWIDANGAIKPEGKWAYKLVDGYRKLYDRSGDAHYLSVIHTAMDYLYSNGKDINGHYTEKWADTPAAPFTTWALNDQACVARAYWQLYFML